MDDETLKGMRRKSSISIVRHRTGDHHRHLLPVSRPASGQRFPGMALSFCGDEIRIAMTAGFCEARPPQRAGHCSSPAKRHSSEATIHARALLRNLTSGDPPRRSDV
jgi:hypothetical protein